jgi:AAA domain
MRGDDDDSFEQRGARCDPGEPPWWDTATPKQAERAKLEIVRYQDMEARLEDRTIVAALLNAGEMSLVVGATGTGKSFLVIDMCLHIAAGARWFGRRTEQTGVLYLATEAGKGIINRAVGYKQTFPDPEDLPLAAVVSPVDLYDATANLIDIIVAIPTLQLSQSVGLIIVDTLSRAMGGGDENSPDGMGGFVTNIDALRHRTGAHVLVVHHLGKDASRGARGHSLLKAAVDTEIEVTRDDATGISTARVTKQRELPTSGSFSFSLRAVELGRNQYGEPITTCILREEQGIDPSAIKKNLSPSQQRALQLLGDAISMAGEVPPANNHIPPKTKCVTEQLWRDYCYKGGISGADKPDSLQKSFKRAAEGLVAAGRVGKWDPWVWLIP